MLIEICEDIIAKAENGDDNTLNLLRILASSNRQGKHLVTSSRKNIDRIVGIKSLDKQTRCIYNSLIEKQYILGYGITNKIDFRVKITFSESTRRDLSNNCIWLNPSEYDLFNYLDATRLLCENLSDCVFYEYCANYYKNEARISKARHNLSHLMGGGNTIGKVYEEAIKSNEYFCLSIIDSDKYFPDSDEGDTAKGVREIDSKYEAFNVSFYVLQGLSEVENMIPKNAINACRVLPNYPDYDTSFLDLKCGLSCFPLRKFNEKYDHWKEILGEANIEKSQTCTRQDDDCNKSCDRITFYSPVYGSDVLEKVLADGNAIKELKRPQLVYNQFDEWRNVGKLLLEWGCSMERLNA